MNKHTRLPRAPKATLWRAVLVVAVLGLLMGICSPSGPAGRALRLLGGTGIAEQHAQDLCAAVKRMDSPERLRAWAQEVMADYASGEIITNRPRWMVPWLVPLSGRELPRWVPRSLRYRYPYRKPDLLIVLGGDGNPEFVECCWIFARLSIFGTNSPNPSAVALGVDSVFIECAEGVFASTDGR